MNPSAEPETRLIQITKGHFALVDAEDFEVLSKNRWTWHPAGYALRVERRDGRQYCITMHRQLMGLQLAGAPAGFQVDHRNGDGLDNRRANLRVCSAQEDKRSRRKLSGKFPYKGIAKKDDEKRWLARIKVDGKLQNLGRYETPEQAARAYDEAAVRFFGEFALTNFPVIP